MSMSPEKFAKMQATKEKKLLADPDAKKCNPRHCHVVDDIMAGRRWTIFSDVFEFLHRRGDFDIFKGVSPGDEVLILFF